MNFTLLFFITQECITITVHDVEETTDEGFTVISNKKTTAKAAKALETKDAPEAINIKKSGFAAIEENSDSDDEEKADNKEEDTDDDDQVLVHVF